MIALIGAVLGCAIGWVVNGVTVTSVVGSGQGGGKTVVLKMLVDSGIMAKGVLLGLAMGFAGGLLPAAGAMRLKPLEAVR